jgi:hypothetical protein
MPWYVQIEIPYPGENDYLLNKDLEGNNNGET